MNAARLLIGSGCAYELAALPERSPLPTITNIVGVGRRHPSPLARLAVAAWLTLWVWHFLTD